MEYEESAKEASNQLKNLTSDSSLSPAETLLVTSLVEKIGSSSNHIDYQVKVNLEIN